MMLRLQADICRLPPKYVHLAILTSGRGSHIASPCELHLPSTNRAWASQHGVRANTHRGGLDAYCSQKSNMIPRWSIDLTVVAISMVRAELGRTRLTTMFSTPRDEIE